MSLPARTGWHWLKAGAGLFRAQPGVLTTLLFANLIASLLISAVPVVGPLIAMVLIPSFSMAVLQACTEIDQGRRVHLSVLATGFRMPAVRALCKLGLVYLAIAVLLTVLTRVTVDPNFWRTVAAPMDPRHPPALSPSDLWAMLLVFALEMLALMAMCFAAPLTYWQKMSPGKATFYSVFAVLGAKRAFGTMLLAWCGAFFSVGMAASVLLGFGAAARAVVMWVVLLFVLLLQCAIYAAYRQIFGLPEPKP